MTRAFVPMSAMAAFAATLLIPISATHAQTVTDLGAAGFSTAIADGTSGGAQVGTAYGVDTNNGDTFYAALLWHGTAAGVVNLTPAGFDGAYAEAISGTTQVGYGYGSATNGSNHALLWNGTAGSVVDLNPAGLAESFAYGVSGNTQVGMSSNHALLWHGTAASVVDLNPDGFYYSQANGASGTAQVGSGLASTGEHALLWHGTAGSAVDLNPAGFSDTQGVGVSGDFQVGNGGGPSIGGTNHPHALLWHGTAGSVVDLNPDGFTGSYATGVSGAAQVGYGDFYPDNVNGTVFVPHALLWHGTAASYVDLGAYLPDGYNTTSEAYGIDENGDVVGTGTGSKGTHAFLWQGTFAPKPFLNDLSPATRTANRGVFTLTVHGTGFTSHSVVDWNGTAQPTTFATSTLLTASIPASLTASAGTAKVAVVTPGLATSGSLTFTVYPDAHIGVIVTDLNPLNFSSSYASGVSGGTQIGGGTNKSGENHAILWQGSAASALGLNPQGATETTGTGVSGTAQVGYETDANGNYQALLWQGSAASAVELTPDGFDFSEAYGISGNSQVGQGTVEESDGDGGYTDHPFPLLWNGTAESAVDLTPTGVVDAVAVGVSGSTQVGSGYVQASNGSYQNHAFLWMGTAASAVDLNPAGSYSSEALGVSGSTQVGDNGGHALLWHGTAASAVDINPANLSGYTSSAARAVSGSIQVGDASGPATGRSPNAPSEDFYAHAMLWRGTADSAIDLNDYLPDGFNISSSASGVDGNDDYMDVVGTAFGGSSINGTNHAYLWHVTFVGKPTVASLSPSFRAAGSGGFTLTVTGTNFTPRSLVQWNNAELTTTFKSSSQVTAAIPAALIAQAGTEQVTVTTPHVATSSAQAFTVSPRPVVTSLSPASKPAGSHAFTLTVNGTGFLSGSLVKWNGMELTTTFVSETKLTAFISASLLHDAGTEQVTVTTPHVATSGSKPFTITP